MGSCQTIQSFTSVPPVESPRWYAVHIRARHEKKVAFELNARKIATFLPLVTEIRKWSDRTTKVEVPLFSCYAFVNFDWSPENRLSVLRVPGVLSFVGGNLQGMAIANSEIESIQTLMRKFPVSAHAFLKVGQWVRVRGGALDGMQGVLVRCTGGNRLVISVETIQRSFSVSVEGYQVESVERIDNKNICENATTSRRFAIENLS